MFEIVGNKIKLCNGDTANIRYSVEGLEMSLFEKAVFTVKKEGFKMLSKTVTKLEPNNDFVVEIVNNDTQQLDGEYLYSLKIFLKDGRQETLISNEDFIVEVVVI